jgi:hypothetical protein
MLCNVDSEDGVQYYVIERCVLAQHTSLDHVCGKEAWLTASLRTRGSGLQEYTDLHNQKLWRESR